MLPARCIDIGIRGRKGYNGAMATYDPDGGHSPTSSPPHHDRQQQTQQTQQTRKTTDSNLLLVLEQYVINDPTCPQNFSRYFNEAIIAAWPAKDPPEPVVGTEAYDEWEDQRARKWGAFLEYCDKVLRNPEVKWYGFPEYILDVIREYDLFDDWSPEEGNGPTGLEYYSIPEKYCPETSSATSVGPAPPATPAPGVIYPTPLTEGTAAKPKSPGQGQPIPMQFMKPTASGKPPTPVTGGPTQEASTGEATQETGVGDKETDVPIDTNGPDFTEDSYDQYGGKREPLAIRLGVIIGYLENQNSQKSSFPQQMSDTIDYLQWLGSRNDRRNQLANASEYTKALYQSAIEKVGTHLKRDQQRAIVTPVVFTDRPVSFSATRSSRLNHLTNIHDFPLPSKRGVPDKSHLLPYSITPSPEKRPIQGKLLENPEHYEQFLADEGKIWCKYSGDLSKLDSMEIPAGLTKDELENNLAAIESDIYVQYVKARGPSASWRTGDPIGWTIQRLDKSGDQQTYITIGVDPETGEEVLHPMDLKDPKDWASVRGVRRAGLQLMLRNYRTNENDCVYYDSDINGQRFRRLVLPIPVATIRKVMESADGRPWIPPTLFDDKKLVWNHWESFLFTDRFRVYTDTSKVLKAQAHFTATERHNRDKFWVTLPKNLINGGPFVWRGLGPKEQAEEDLLKQCLAVRDFIAMCWNKAPRPLLGNMIQFLILGDQTSSKTFPEPETLGKIGLLTFDESEYSRTAIGGARQRAGYRYINDEDIQWLKFLGSGCVNKKSWTGKIFPDQPKTTYRLFHIFAKRVLRLLEDPNPEGIFYSSSNVVTVETLLKVVNAGANGKSAVNKYEFSVYEACQHLDRLDQTGHIDFQLDPACYGQVRRPAYEFYPEHRIAYNSGGTGCTTIGAGQKLFPKSVREWFDICLDPHTGQTKDPPHVSNAVDNFYRALAYRLGFTIFQLQNKSVARKTSAVTRNQQAPSYAWLQDSIKKFNIVHEEMLTLLLHTRPSPPAPYGDTWKDIKALVQDVEFLDGGRTDPSAHPLISKRAYLADNHSALRHLRTKIITELRDNNTLLAPARAKKVINPATGDVETTLTRAVSWKFGSLILRQEGWRRQWFSINRWPVVAQSEATQNKIKNDKWFIDGVDPRQTFDYQSADPIHALFCREKLGPYIEEPVKYRQGPAMYLVGDTKHQRKMVENHMTALVYESIGLDQSQTQGTFKAKLKSLLTLGGLFSGKGGGKVTDAELEEKYGKLSPVTVDRVPRSWSTQLLIVDKVLDRKRRVDEIMTMKEQEREMKEIARYKRQKVDDDIVGTKMTI
ncbi:hypothetical protein QBC36DRAFT_372254 [Triangularia setosa]|uniref:Uncharacterized protein n=1 Tax=Triangularia setosa TaxID=2587417 RepID=A0AAN6WFU5_9PEZI|nr:hypothetical protein QBC36DRAFT_372254 [Podospora setosa]